MMKLLKFNIFILALLLAQFSAAKEEIGVASAVNKNTTDLTLEEERKLVQAGYKIIQNHTLETDAIGRAALLLIDGTSFSIGPNSSVTLDKFIYNPETAEGSLEVSSRGLLRLVGGKVTKKRPALIRTNSATVGIRGGITIVQTQGLSTSAAFVYGDELTMTPNQNSSAATSLIENGFVVTVEDPTAEVGEPQQLSETFLAELQKGLEARENDEDSDAESSEEESSEEESTEEESTEESTQEESSDEQSEESSEETTTEESTTEEQSESTTEETNTSEDQGQDSETQQESASATETESGADNSTTQDDSTSDSSVETQTSDQADTSAGVDNDPQPDVDESALDSSGVSDNSSDIAPTELSTADDVVDTAVDVVTTSDEVEETTEETEEASETSIEDTAAVATSETVVEEAPFDASLSNESIQINENETDINLATLQTNKDDDVEVTVTIDGEDKDLFQYDPSTNSLSFIGDANYEDKTNFSLNLIVQREDEEVVIPVNISVSDVNEAPSVSAEIQDSYAEDISIGSVLVGVTISDPENQEVTYSISGEGSDKFSIDEAGNITLAESFDFEAKASYTLTVTATDGELSSETEVLINVGDINEAPSLSSTLALISFSEDSAIGTIIATSSASDPESNIITYSLTGTGSEYFNVDENGNITLKDTLDFETSTNYEITLVASDGELTSTSVITFDISDVDEAPSLSSALKSESFEESIAVGTALASISSIDPESQTITYSLSGTGSENFEIDSEGNITSKVAFDYETATSYTFNVTASDGTNSTTSPLTITLSDVNESPDVTISLQGNEFAENITTGSTIATIAYTDPESDELTYTLSGTGSDQFSIDDQGVITLKTGLDYETKTSYELTLTSSDGTNSVQTQISFSVTDISELALSLDSTEVTLAENISTGSSVANASSSDAAGEVTYSISDLDDASSESNIFAIDSQGRITLKAALDFESKTSYTLAVSASDGKETTTKQLTVTVSDVDLSVTSSLASANQAETISTGTSILTLSTSNAEGTLSYSITDSDNKFSIDSSTGEVTLANALDYETKTSHSFTVTVTDGITTSSETFTLNVTDVDLSISASLASASQTEGITTGTTIVSAPTASNAEGAVTYSLTDADNKFAVNSSTGAVTLANNLDFETKTSHTFTLTASDGTTTTSQTFTLNVTDVDQANPITSIASTTLSEGASTGASVASVSSIENDTGSSLTYSITAGNSDGRFTVNSSTGAITTAAGLNFKNAKSYTLTLTASGGGETTSSNVVIPIQNSEDLASATVRFSTAYHSASRNGFSATATRGPSGSSMSNYVLEQATNDGGNLLDVSSSNGGKDTTNNYVQAISQDTNQMVDIQYWFPVVTANNAYQGTFAGSANTPDTAKIVDAFNSSNKIDIALSEILYGGQDSTNENFYFMQLDKDETSLSVVGSIDMLVMDSYQTGDYSSNLRTRATAKGINVTYSRIQWSGSSGWPTSTSPMAAYYDTLSDYEIIWDNRLADNGYAATRPIWEGEQERIEAWAADPGSLGYSFVNERCCGRDYAVTYMTSLISNLGGSITFDSQADRAGGSNSGLTLPSFYDGIKNFDVYDSGPGYSVTACTGCTMLFPKGDNKYGGAYFRSQDLESGTTADIFSYQDIQVPSSSSNTTLMDWYLDTMINKHGANQIYQSFQDQFIFAGNIFKESHWGTFANNLGDGDKHVMAGVMIPIRNFSAGTEYFYPNFIPSNAWSDSYGDVGLTYNANTGSSPEDWAWVKEAQNGDAFTGSSSSSGIQSCRFRFTDTCSGENINEVPEGQSLFWQLFQRTNSTTRAPKIGLWAQISFKDSYDGASGSTTRDDQQSLFSVLIADYDYRKNDTTRYSVGDTNYSLDGYHYWSYQDPTNADDNSKALIYGTSPVECVTTRESGCWYSGTGGRPQASLLTPSDPYSSEDMKLSVFYNANTGNFDQGTFAHASMTQNVAYSVGSTNARVESIPISYPRNTRFYDLNNSSNYQGFFSGILEFHDSGKSQLASMRSSSTLASFSFDETNDLVQVTAPLSITSAPANNYTSTWSAVDTGAMTVKFGDANNADSKSAYISKEIFGAEIQDDGSQIDGSSGGTGNLAGAMVSFNTIEVADSDLFHNNGNDPMPDSEFSTWGFWAMSAADISPNSGDQNASVHLGTWVGGDLVDQSDIPTSGSASMSGAAAVNVAYRYNQTGTNYDVHKYTTTADVSASFSWGASGYSGALDFTNFDDKHPIVANAGFASFSVAITGTNNTYTGTSTDSLDNSWLGGAAVAGALFGDDSPKESGGRVNVNLYKSGDIGTAGANDFYTAEGIYLLCISGGC